MILKHLKHTGAALAAFTIFATTATLSGQSPAAPAQRNFPVPGGGFNAPKPQLQLPPIPTPVAITPNGQVVEDVIARINDQIITRSEYERSVEQLVQEGQQAQAPPEAITEHVNTLLRDMIDQKLLLSKGKELGITGDAEVIRQLDDIRKKNHLDSMEALEKAATSQGVSYEDFKQSIRNQVIQQQVVRDEVGRRLQMTQSQEKAYYDAHTKDFELPEQVHLSEILIPTPENATDAQVSAAQSKADAVAAKLTATNFAEIAKTSSGGPTASAGGDLGDFKRGTLGDVLEKATFDLPAGGTTAPIRTRQGFVILHVDTHQKAGVAPMADVEQDIQQALYVDALQPALRAYLTKARSEAYIDIKPGFVDAGSATRSANKPLFTAYTPPPVKKKIVVKQKAEQEKAARDAAELAAAREKVREKQEAKAAEDAKKAGVKNVNMPVKPKKIRREKIRYGQAPRNSLPAGLGTTQENDSAPLAGVAPGVALAGNNTSVTSVSSGTGADTDVDPLAQQAPPEKKTRFTQRQTEQEANAAQAKLAKAEVKATTRPVAATHEQSESEKVQAAPLGLNGDTVKKQPKAKHKKGDPKERMQEQVKPAVETPTPVAPTANPKLMAPATGTTTAPAVTSDQSTIPSTTSAPGASTQGQPLPATTSATPGAPVTTPSPK